MSADPRFPDRPDHPDFWLISQALIDQDAQADAGQPFTDVVERIVDRDSLIYAAEQRGLRFQAGRSKPSVAERVAMQAAWVDAFLAGARYQALKERRLQELRDDELT